MRTKITQKQIDKLNKEYKTTYKLEDADKNGNIGCAICTNCFNCLFCFHCKNCKESYDLWHCENCIKCSHGLKGMF